MMLVILYSGNHVVIMSKLHRHAFTFPHPAREMENKYHYPNKKISSKLKWLNTVRGN